MSKKDDRIILVDADVVSHFIVGGMIIFLPKIFNHKMYVLDKVYSELEKFPQKKVQIKNLIDLGILMIYPFPETNDEIKREYAHIKKFMFKGDGESACLAVARHTKDIIGSSNLKDIKIYCEMHQIEYITTMDFLYEAMTRNIISESDCDEFINKVLRAGSKLPVKCMKDFKAREIFKKKEAEASL